MKVQYPKAYPDIKVFTIKPIIGEEKRIIGTKMNDRTMEISETIEDVILEAIKLYDGMNSLDDINEKLMEMNISVDVDKLTKILADNGMLLGVEGKCFNEVKIVGTRLVKIRIGDRINWVLRKICKGICMIYPFSIVLLFLLSMFLLIQVKDDVDLLYFRHVGLYSVPFSYIFGILHEFGHIIYAIAHDIEIDSVEVRLTFGVMPIIFVKYNGLYFMKTVERLNLILSGIYFHLIMILFAFLIILITNSVIFKTILVSNILNIIANSCPYQITDGYYALCTIFGKYNIRLKILKNLLKRKRKFQLKDIALSVVYVSLIFIALIGYITSMYEFSFNFESIFHIDKMIFFVSSIILLTFQWIGIIKKLKKTL